jgi:hypothetical protein
VCRTEQISGDPAQHAQIIAERRRARGIKRLQ